MNQGIEQLKAAQPNLVEQGLAISGGSGQALDHAFFDYFDIEVASEGSVVDAAHKLRYDVFCQEKGWESAAEHPEGLERDTYDRRSVHCLLRYRPTEQPVGCMRLILADCFDVQAPFPFEKVYEPLVGETGLDLLALDRSVWAEVSRLTILPNFRTGNVDKYADPVRSRRAYNSVWPWLGLCVACTSLTIELGLQEVFAIMERPLAIATRRAGYQWRQVGAVVDHHGLRAPYQVSSQSLLHDLKPEAALLRDAIREQIRPAMLAAGLMLEEKPWQRAA